MQHVFIVGAKSLGKYGGYETFINKLTEYHAENTELKYHVSVKANGQGASVPNNAVYTNDRRYVYHNADCFEIHVPEILGAAQAIYYDCKALSVCIRIIKDEKIENPIVYVLTCRIGPFFNHYVKKLHSCGGKVFLNPDGHEWKRAKWNKLVRAYWKRSECLMVNKADLIICDSKNIEKYIHEEYSQYNTEYIAYGADVCESTADDVDWLSEKGLTKDKYYLVVGRFVPENNYETMIREFMKTKTDKCLAIITNVNLSFLEELDKITGYSKDERIKFCGTVYDENLLKKIREDAYGYLHGHEVGGTNPSLLEALASTKLNLLLDVGFNHEVAEDGAFYWTKSYNNLKELIEKCEDIDRNEISERAKTRIKEFFSWEYICKKYEKVFVKQ